MGVSFAVSWVSCFGCVVLFAMAWYISIWGEWEITCSNVICESPHYQNGGIVGDLASMVDGT